MPRGRRAPVSGRLVPPLPSRADFHTHTLRSDGLLEPTELVTAAAAAGVRTLALTDHDTLAGYRELVAPWAPALPVGLELIPGIEINATVDDATSAPDGELHFVGLGTDPDDEAFEAILDRQRGARRRRFERMLARLREAGVPVDAHLDGLDRSAEESLGRPTIARALVEAGFARDVPDAFDRFVGPGGPGYVRREAMGPAASLAAIRAAGGLPVLAHFAPAPDRLALVRDLIGAGLGGIEVHHRSFDAPTVERMRAVAAALRLVPSGGTDFHGDECTYAEAIAETYVPDAVADEMRRALGLGSAAGAR
ncbi:MAG TPA: PHP domain-containing protein [Patescibacteria group bacterium]|nr:PHP domain-containing protein [Patescibacteria group bacterium]